VGFNQFSYHATLAQNGRHHLQNAVDKHQEGQTNPSLQAKDSLDRRKHSVVSA
jgi:hypothetical protein